MFAFWCFLLAATDERSQLPYIPEPEPVPSKSAALFLYCTQ